MPTRSTQDIVAAFGPTDAWEAAQIAKAVALDAAAIALCDMVVAAATPDLALALGQGILALERASRLALAALARRRTRMSSQPVATSAPTPTTHTDPRVRLSPEKAAIWDRFLGQTPAPPHPGQRQTPTDPAPATRNGAALAAPENPSQAYQGNRLSHRTAERVRSENSRAEK